MMFDALNQVRATLASIPAFEVSASARERIVAAIDQLDDAMVADIRTGAYVASMPETFDMARFANDFLGSLPKLHMGVTH